MSDIPGENGTVRVAHGWLRLGILLALANLAYLGMVVLALQRSLWLGIAVAVLGSIVGVLILVAVVFGPIDVAGET